jgi:hypothetical protein
MHRMFAAVVCPECGKPFQVPRAALGEPAGCPWCGQTVAALPVATKAKPLSLDDAVQLPPVAKNPGGSRPSLAGLVVKLAVVAAACVVVGIGAFVVSRYGPRLLADAGWRTFAPADGGCRAALPAEPVEEAVPANPASPVTRGGKRFAARPRFGPSAAVGWLDLDPEKARVTRAEDAIAAERDRRAAELGGTVAREAAVKDGARDGRQVEFDTPAGPWVERYVYAPDGPRPRLYFAGVTGPADAPAARRVLDSFRVE